jgi:acetyl esterase/lipase
MQTPQMRAAITARGQELGPEILRHSTDLFAPEQQALADAMPPSVADAAYGPHARHRLDLYGPTPAGQGPAPVLLFVHGGGFRLGDKGDGGRWPNAAVGRMAARAGFLGAVMNYRLAPESGWPSGGEDVAAVVEWLKGNAAAHGGDPERLVLAGTSAGAVHISTYLQLRVDAPEQVRAAVLLSGLYGFTPLDERDTLYYGAQSLYGQRMPLEAVASTPIPLLLACAEFDPPRFQSEFLGLLQRRLERDGRMPRAYVASGHNHYSMAMHLGTSDARLADEIIAFAREHCA